MQTAPEGHYELDNLSNKIIKLMRLEDVFKNWISEKMSHAMGNGMGKKGSTDRGQLPGSDPSAARRTPHP